MKLSFLRAVLANGRPGPQTDEQRRAMFARMGSPYGYSRPSMYSTGNYSAKGGKAVSSITYASPPLQGMPITLRPVAQSFGAAQNFIKQWKAQFPNDNTTAKWDAYLSPYSSDPSKLISDKAGLDALQNALMQDLGSWTVDNGKRISPRGYYETHIMGALLDLAHAGGRMMEWSGASRQDGYGVVFSMKNSQPAGYPGGYVSPRQPYSTSISAGGTSGSSRPSAGNQPAPSPGTPSRPPVTGGPYIGDLIRGTKPPTAVKGLAAAIQTTGGRR